MAERYEYEGLEDIEKDILAHVAEASYVVVTDVTNWKNPEPCGRYDLVNDVASAPAEDLGDAVEGEDDSEGDEGDGEDSEATSESEPEADTAPAERAMHWIRTVARQHTVGDVLRKFRVRVYAPKASALLLSGQFVCRDLRAEDGDQALDELARSAPQPTMEAARAESHINKAVRALGDGYAQFMQIVLGTVAQLQQVNNSATSRMSKTNASQQEHVENLMAAVINMKIADATARGSRDAAETETASRERTLQQALKGFENLSSTYLMAQGLTPEFASILSKVPELKQFLENAKLRTALEDVDVRELLRDPKNLEELAQLLNHVAQQKKAQKAATAGAS